MRADLGGAEDGSDLGGDLPQPLGGGTELPDPRLAYGERFFRAGIGRRAVSLKIRHGDAPLHLSDQVATSSRRTL